MKKIKTLHILLGLILDILAILTYFGLNASSTWAIIISAPTWLIIVLIVTFMLLLRIIIEKIYNIKDLYENHNIKNDLEKALLETDVNKINTILPSTKTLKILQKRVTNRSISWAEDALLRRINLYVDYNKTWQIPILQVYFYSDWKKEKAVFYEGRYMSDDYEESIISLNKIENQDYRLKPFFELNPEWQKEVGKAFNSVSSRVTNKFSIGIHQSKEYYCIAVGYNEGRVKKRKNFNLDNNFHLKQN